MIPSVIVPLAEESTRRREAEEAAEGQAAAQATDELIGRLAEGQWPESEEIAVLDTVTEPTGLFRTLQER